MDADDFRNMARALFEHNRQWAVSVLARGAALIPVSSLAFQGRLYPIPDITQLAEFCAPAVPPGGPSLDLLPIAIDVEKVLRLRSDRKGRKKPIPTVREQLDKARRDRYLDILRDRLRWVFGRTYATDDIQFMFGKLAVQGAVSHNDRANVERPGLLVTVPQTWEIRATGVGVIARSCRHPSVKYRLGFDNDRDVAWRRIENG